MISGVVGFEPTTKILEIPIITNLTILLYYKIKFNLYLYTNYNEFYYKFIYYN